jgi:hypothetical protein
LKKKLVFFCLLVLIAAAAFAKPIGFKLVNHTNLNIEEICFAATNDEEWGDDILGGEGLEAGWSLDVTFDAEYEAQLNKDNVKIFDMLCVIDGEKVELYDLELAKIKTLELKLDKDGYLITKTK